VGAATQRQEEAARDELRHGAGPFSAVGFSCNLFTNINSQSERNRTGGTLGGEFCREKMEMKDSRAAQEASTGQETKAKRERVASTSGDICESQVARLRQLFPEVFVEGKIDFDRLKVILGAAAEPGPGRFHFSWAGKDEAISLLQTPSSGTLTPSPEESINFETTSNAFIEGDNLEVLKLLFKSYFGRVKLIYIDPPYNTGQDFIYPDNYADPLKTYLQLTGQVDAEGNLLTSNPETGGRYHSSWLSMMYPRLFLARQLLREDGLICISIDDHEVHHLRLIMNEVFGEENFVATIIWQKVYAPKNSAMHLSEDHDYIVLYARDAETWRPTLLARTEEANARYDNADNDPRGAWKPGDLTARNYYSEGQYEVTAPGGKKFRPSTGNYWRVNPTKFDELDKDKRIWWGENGNNMPALKRFLTEVKQGMVPQTLWTYDEVGHTQEAKKELLEYVKYENTDNVLDTVKPTRLLKRILQIGTVPTTQDIVLDFFGGSCSTGHAVVALNREDGGNRHFICVQLPEPLPKPETNLKNLTDVGKERLRNVIKELNEKGSGRLALDSGAPAEDLGFKVFKLAKPNIQRWEAEEERDTDVYAQKLSLFNDPLVAGWKPENVIWEVALREGFGLNTRFASRELPNGNTVFEVSDPDTEQKFTICLDERIAADLSKNCELRSDDLFVCRDTALDDSAAANLALQCRLKTI
jgi:adenine-specific DNA-methyltransferase